MRTICILFFLSLLIAGRAQEPVPAPAPSEPPKDGLGRSTPRGTVLGFLAAHRRDYAGAAKYLNTSLEGAAAEELANQLIVVLDRRLPARLDQASNRVDGSLNDNLPLGEDSVGSVQTSNGPLEILLRRVQRRDTLIWLFSDETLKQIPEVYSELNSTSPGIALPEWLLKRGWLSVPLWQWIAILAGLGLGAGISRALRRIAMPLLRGLFGRFLAEQDNGLLDLLAAPIRALTLLAVCTRR
jgi:MscS family membrane protein